MKFVDVHAHLDQPEFAVDRAAVIERAVAQGCIAIINNAIDVPSFESVIALAKQFPVCKSALGLYPDTVVVLGDQELTAALKRIEQEKNNIVAIGEIGLDYKHTADPTLREKQKVWFIKQLDLATKLKKPVIIHSRDAEADVIKILLEKKQKNVVMHCYCGPHDIAQDAAKAGIYFSVPVRAVSSKPFQKLIAALPSTALLTETDSPYLHYKQERNEPANIPATIRCIATVRECDVDETANMLFANYLRLFR